jgi:uncharacterized membrane protein YcaP (DUF421 family)
LLIILLRTVIIYFLVLFAMRIMGKAELSNLDPFQIVMLFMIAELAAFPIESPDISILAGISAIAALLFLEVFISYISTKSRKVSAFFKGKPSILIDKGALNIKELKKLRITIEDLAQLLRIKDIPAISDVDYVVMETNGEISVIPKSEKAPVTKGDLNVNNEYETMPMVLIADGALLQENLNRLGITENNLKKELEKHQLKDYSQVFLCFFDEDRKIHAYPKQKTQEPIEEAVKGGNKA